MIRSIRALVATLVMSSAAVANDHVAAVAPVVPLTAPSDLVSRHGQLHVDLTAAPAEYTIGSERFESMLYNDAYIPPVWRLEPGDMLTVALHNSLQQPTNLHFHGLHVSPRENGDNVFLHVGPGESFQYRIQIPHDHDSGLYWFHTHAHGFVSQQIIAGLPADESGDDASHVRVHAVSGSQSLLYQRETVWGERHGNYGPARKASGSGPSATRTVSCITSTSIRSRSSLRRSTVSSSQCSAWSTP